VRGVSTDAQVIRRVPILRAYRKLGFLDDGSCNVSWIGKNSAYTPLFSRLVTAVRKAAAPLREVVLN